MTEAPVFTLDDPRPIAAEAPYTYFLPSPEELAALAPGDMVKLVFRPLASGTKWAAEGMWVTVNLAGGDTLAGRLENEPDDMPGLRCGDTVSFQRHHVVDCIWSHDRQEAPPAPPQQREYWDRCVVDRCVTEDNVPLHYLCRQERDLAAEGEEYPDSGWRIWGDYRGLNDDEIDARETEYVALGRVLNADDSWLHLIDEPVGSRFIRDWTTGNFVPDD